MSRNSEPMESRAAVLAGVAATAALCLWGALETYGFERAYQQQNRDPYMVEAQFARLAGIAATVPENAVMGYLTDAQDGSAGASAMLAGAQYVLAPRLLARGTGHEWVLGNFTRPGDFAAVGRSHGLELQQDFGNGAVLYRHEAPR